MTNTSKNFVTVEHWEKTERLFKTTYLTTTQEGFDCPHEALMSLAVKFTNDKGGAVAALFGRLVKIDKTEKADVEKVEKMMKKWAGMYVNKLARFGCQSTDRVEGGHATLKSILTNASDNLLRAYESIHKWYTGMDERIKRQLDVTRFKESTSFLSSVYVRRV